MYKFQISVMIMLEQRIYGQLIIRSSKLAFLLDAGHVTRSQHQGANEESQ